LQLSVSHFFQVAFDTSSPRKRVALSLYLHVKSCRPELMSVYGAFAVAMDLKDLFTGVDSKMIGAWKTERLTYLGS
jgi:hypothetical protein